MSETLVSHINHAIVAKTHTPMYLMHKYWARKPHNVVREYIERYSSEGEIVLDPFCGSGVTAIEALKAGRKAIATDLDPMANFITNMTATPMDLKAFADAYKQIEERIKWRIDEFYHIKCFRCKRPVISEAVIWHNDKPIDIRYSCTCREGTLWKRPDVTDIALLKKIQGLKIRHWYPDNELIWNTRINVHKGTKVSDLFTRRNLLALSMIFQQIESIKDRRVREMMKFTFTSTLGQSSKLVFVIRKRGRSKGQVSKGKKEVGSWATRGYWVPPEFFEVNAWNCFKERFDKIVRGKEESNREINTFIPARSIEDLLNGKSNILVKTISTLELTKHIQDESVDYVFTDPPYGDSVPYLELDYMWSSWLKFDVNFNDEIIISDSPDRKEKNFELYYKMLCSAFNEIYRVLKPAKYLTVTFHNTDIKIYNAIINSCILAGFDLEKIVYQPPARPSAKSGLAPYASAVGDYYIRFRKPFTARKHISKEEIDDERFCRIVISAIRKIIAERGQPTPYSIIVNSYAEIFQKIKESGHIFNISQGIDEILTSRLEKYFIRKDGKWWFKNPSEVPHLQHVPLSERVETSVLEMLNKQVKVSFDDVLQEIFIRFPNALTPEITTVNHVLKEYATKTKDKKWMLKPQIKESMSVHNQIVQKLAVLGHKAGFLVHADLKEFTDEEIPLNNIPKKNLDRIKRIDCIWYDSQKIRYAFEVEHTTNITDAIVRGSNIPYPTKKFIVIPERKENKLAKKLEEPFVKERQEHDHWGFIRFCNFITFHERNKNKKNINLKELEKLNKPPNPPRQRKMTQFA